MHSVNFILNVMMEFVYIASDELYFGFDAWEFLTPILLQALLVLFSIVTVIRFPLQKFRIFVFPVVVFLILNIIFFYNLEYDHGYFFRITNSSIAFKVIVVLYPLPINLCSFKSLIGSFDDGFFWPADTPYFYYLYIVMPVVYFTIVSWLAVKLERLI